MIPGHAGQTSATLAEATTPAPKSSVGSVGGGGGLLTLLVGSILVIGLALVVTRWLARWQFMQGKGRRMRVLEGLAIGRDRQLLLVQVGEEILLLGSAEGGVNLVHRVDDPELVQAWLADQPAADGLAQSTFSGVESAVRANLDRMRGLLLRNGGRGDA